MTTHVVVTVHGIRTFGAWQARLARMLEEAEPGIQVLNYNYGWFSIFAFLFPPLRWLVTLRFRRHLKAVKSDYPDAQVDLVGHSFGTHLIGWSVRRLSKVDRPCIGTIILAASVLRPGFKWNPLIRAGAVTRVLNECGTADVVLLVNQLAVLFTGVAGILGFKGLTSGAFRNDYHRLQHSGYFRRGGVDDNSFMAARWVPLLTRGVMPAAVDERPQTTAYGVFVFLLQNLEFVKLAAYALSVGLAVLWARNLAAERAGGLARRLAAESQTVGIEARRLPESLALAIRSVRTADTREGTAALRHAIQLFPAVETTLQYDGSPSLVSFSPDDGFLASVWDRRSVHVTDVRTRRDAQSFAVDTPIQALAWSSQPGDYRLYLFTEDGRFWSVTPHGVTSVRTRAPRAHTAAIAERDGNPLLGLVLDGFRVQFRSVAPDVVRAEITHEQPIGVTFRAGGRRAATCGYDGRVNVWSLGAGARLTDLLSHDEPVSVVAFHPDDRRVAFADNFGTVVVRDLTSKRDEFRVRLGGAVSALDFSPDGRWLIGAASDGTRLWDWSTGRELSRMIDEGDIASATFAHDGARVAVAGEASIRIWSFPTELPIDPPGNVSALAVNDAGDRVFVGDSYGNIDVVTLAPRPSVVPLLRASGQESAVLALAVSGDTLTAAFDTGTARTWRDGTPAGTHSLLSGLFTTMALTADGGTLAAGDWDGSVLLVNRDGTAVPSAPFQNAHAIDGLAFVTGRRALAIAAGGQVELWDWLARPPVVESRAPATGSLLAFSADGRRVLTSDAVGAREWAWDGGAVLASVETYGAPTSAAFFRGDDYVAIGSGNKTARRVVIAPLSSEALIREGCARLSGYLRRAPPECS